MAEGHCDCRREGRAVIDQLHHAAAARPSTCPLSAHLRPLMPQKTRVGNDRSQSTTHVARRRNRNEKLYKAGARSSVTLAAQNADRRAAVSEIELALSDP